MDTRIGQGIIMNLRQALLNVRTCATNFAAGCVAFLPAFATLFPSPGRGVRRTLALSESWESQNQSELEETMYRHGIGIPSSIHFL